MSKSGSAAKSAGREITLGSTVGMVDEFVSPADLKAGAEIVGTYLQSYTGGQYNTTTHKLRNSNGTVIGLNGTGQLNKLMALVPKGATIKVVYEGKSTIKNGPNAGKKAHNFRVFDLSSDQDQADYSDDDVA